MAKRAINALFCIVRVMTLCHAGYAIWTTWLTWGQKRNKDRKWVQSTVRFQNITTSKSCSLLNKTITFCTFIACWVSFGSCKSLSAINSQPTFLDKEILSSCGNSQKRDTIRLLMLKYRGTSDHTVAKRLFWTSCCRQVRTRFKKQHENCVTLLDRRWKSG